jgi:DNA processing protein
MASPAYVALSLVPGIGRVRLDLLLQRFETAEATLAASRAELDDVTSISPAAATAIKEATPDAGQRILDQAAALGACVLEPRDAAFPAALTEIPDAPILLFALGDVALLSKRAVAMVGTRDQTRYGGEVARHFAGGSARAGLVVVSGMARGIDASVHAAALDAGGGTVGVLGNGLGTIYPAANAALYERVAREGCLLTEYAPGERPHAGSFPRRNRLISGLARITLVVEAGDGSGALITADCAVRQGRDVLAVPGPITSPLSAGCNRLIRDGAKPALGLRDILEEYGLATPAAPGTRIPTDLTPDERRVLDLLGAGVELPDDLAVRLEQPAAVALAALTSLEIRGLVVPEAGRRFRLAAGVTAPAGSAPE